MLDEVGMCDETFDELATIGLTIGHQWISVNDPH